MLAKHCIIDNIPTTYYVSPSFAPEAATVFFVHGRGQDSTSFAPLCALLDAKKVSRVALDLPGFGTTSQPKSVRGVKEYAEFVAIFVKKIRLTDCTFVGHSFGCRLGLWLSAHACNLRTKQILIGPGGVEKISGTGKKFVLAVGKKVFSLPGLRTMGHALKKRLGGNDYNTASGITQQILVKVVNEDLTPLLHKISVPTTVIWGEKDDQILRRQIEILQQNIPKCMVKTFINGDHFVHLQYPKEIVQEILDI